MSKSPSGRKRATQASPPTGKSDTPPAPAPAKPSRSGSSLRAHPAGSGPPRPLPRPARANRRRPRRPRETEPQDAEESGVPASFRPRREDRRPSAEQIAIHAYHLWLARGQPVGTDWDDWLEAERQLVASA